MEEVACSIHMSPGLWLCKVGRSVLEGYKTFFSANKELNDNKFYDEELTGQRQKQGLCAREIMAEGWGLKKSKAHRTYLTKVNKSNRFYGTAYRSRWLQILCKIDVLKSFAKFTGKHLYRSPYLAVFASSLQLYQKRDSATSVFPRNLRNF